MWFAWVIVLLAILSVLIVIIILPLFRAWYTSGIIFIIVGIAIIVIGTIWFNSITGLPTSTFNPSQERAAAISSIIFGILMFIIGFGLIVYGYINRNYLSLGYTIGDCEAVISNPLTDPYTDVTYKQCINQYPELIEQRNKEIENRIISEQPIEKQIISGKGTDERMADYFNCKEECSEKYPKQSSLYRGCITGCISKNL